MANKKISQKIKDEVLEHIRSGKSQYSASKKYKVSAATICNWAKEEGIEIKHSLTKNANKAHLFYNKEGRITLFEKFLEKCGAMLNEEITPHQMQALGIAIGTMVDKYRQEETHGSEGRAAILTMMDEIIASRSTR